VEQSIQNDVLPLSNLLVVEVLFVEHHAIKQEHPYKQHQENKVHPLVNLDMYELDHELLNHHLVMMTYDTRQKQNEYFFF
jgi:hypothetical protein